MDDLPAHDRGGHIERLTGLVQRRATGPARSRSAGSSRRCGSRQLRGDASIRPGGGSCTPKPRPCWPPTSSTWTAPLSSPSSGSSAGLSSAVSSTNVSEPRKSPDQNQWPSSGIPQAHQQDQIIIEVLAHATFGPKLSFHDIERRCQTLPRKPLHLLQRPRLSDDCPLLEICLVPPSHAKIEVQ